jgi:hypothetical protein
MCILVLRNSVLALLEESGIRMTLKSVFYSDIGKLVLAQAGKDF